jgi:hypothetical protein
MDIKEAFETTLDGFNPPLRGTCLTIDGKVPPSYKVKNSYNDCANLCSLDDSCSGFSYDTNNVCIIYNPSVGGDINSNPAPKGFPLFKSTNDIDTSACVIKTQNPLPNYDNYVGKCQTPIGGTPDYATAYPISFKLCSTICDKDPNCRGYNYDSTGKCVLYNPSIFQSSGNDTINPLTKGDNNSENNNLCYIKQNQINNNIQTEQLPISNNTFQSPPLTVSLSNPTPINYSLDNWTVSNGQNFVDVGYFSGDITKTIAPSSISMSVSTAQTIKQSDYITNLSITVPSYLVNALTNDYLDAWIIWASYIANTNGFNMFSFQNGKVGFGVYGYATKTSTNTVDTVYRYNSDGVSTTTQSNVFLVGQGTNINHVFITKELKTFIDSFTQIFKGDCRSSTNTFPPYIEKKTTINDCRTLCMNDSKCQAISYIPSIENDILTDTTGTCRLYDMSTTTILGGTFTTGTTGAIITKGDLTNTTCYIPPKTTSTTSTSTTSTSTAIQSSPLYNKSGVLIYNNKQYAFIKPNLILEQIIQNKVFEQGMYYYEAHIINPTNRLVSVQISLYVVGSDNKQYKISNTTLSKSESEFTISGSIMSSSVSSLYLGNRIKLTIDSINSLADIYIDGISLSIYKQVSSTTSSTNNITTSSTIMPTNFTMYTGRCKTYDTKEPVYTLNNRIPMNTCANMCNNDTNCSAYSYYNATQTCTLYNYTFHSQNGTVDVEPASTATTKAGEQPFRYTVGNSGNITYNPISTSNTDINYKCFIKNNITPIGYLEPKLGVCSTVNTSTTLKKYVPSISARVPYSTCAAACNNDSKCSGFSYKDDGTCTIHDPTLLPNQVFNTTTSPTTTTTTSANRSPSGTPLIDGDGSFFTNCYIKIKTTTTTNTPTMSSTSPTMSSTTTTTTTPTMSSTSPTTTTPTTTTTTSSTSITTTTPTTTTTTTTTPTTTTTTTTPTTTTPTTTTPTMSSTSPTMSSTSPTTPTTTTSSTSITTTTPTTSPTTTSSKSITTTTPSITFSSNNLVNSSLVSPNTIDIAISSQVEETKYDEIVKEIINIINPNDTYKLTQQYIPDNNLIIIRVGNNTTSSSAEFFENSSTGLTIRVIYDNNIQINEQPAIKQILSLVIKPTGKTTVSEKTTSNKTPIIVGSVIGIVVLLILIFIYLRFIKKHK